MSVRFDFINFFVSELYKPADFPVEEMGEKMNGFLLESAACATLVLFGGISEGTGKPAS